MDLKQLKRHSEFLWEIPRQEGMQAPGYLCASEELVLAMEAKVVEQLRNVATLPGLVGGAYAMPDAHEGYGFPIGGVAAFDPIRGGVISAGGVGFDISCGVRTLLTGLRAEEVMARREEVADALFRAVPAGVGKGGEIRLNDAQMERMLREGAAWAVQQGYGTEADLERIEEGGCFPHADPSQVSDEAKNRQRHEMGTLGSGNHYLEIQRVERIFDVRAAEVYGLREGEVVVTIHCGSRGLGHQVATDYGRLMGHEASRYGIRLKDRELAAAPADSPLGEAYFGAMACAVNCALANRQIIAHLAQEVMSDLFPAARMPLLYDVSHNICKEERHRVEGRERRLMVHRKGATRAFGPGHPGVVGIYRAVGQPVLIGGSMGTASYILAGMAGEASLAFGSACHGAGRRMSRSQAAKRWSGSEVVAGLGREGVVIRAAGMRGVAEEAPGAYKDVEAVVESAQRAGLARRVARVRPVVCIKG